MVPLTTLAGVVERQVAPHGPGERACDGETESESLRLGAAQRLEERRPDGAVERRPVVGDANDGAAAIDLEPNLDDAAGDFTQGVQAIVEQVFENGSHVRRIGVGGHRARGIDVDRVAVLGGESADVFGQRGDDMVQSDAFEIRLCQRAHGAQNGKLRQRAVGLSPRSLREIGATRFIAFTRGLLVEQETERVERIIELVQNGRRENPHRLIALDLVQADLESLGSARRFVGRRKLSPQFEIVRAHAEKRSRQDRNDAVDHAVNARHRAGQRSAFESRLRENVENDVRYAEQRARRDVDEEARVFRVSAQFPGHAKDSTSSLAPMPYPAAAGYTPRAGHSNVQRCFEDAPLTLATSHERPSFTRRSR
jgi:hypothetical protein